MTLCRLTAKLSEANSLLNENELLLQEREEEIERTKSQLLPSKDIDTLKKELLEHQTFVGMCMIGHSSVQLYPFVSFSFR